MQSEEAATVVKEASFLRSAIGGSFAGMCQVKMQAAESGQYRGVWHCIASTYKEGGLRAFFNGATPALTTAIIENTLVFGANEAFKNMLMRRQPDPTKPLPLPALAAVGGAAGFFQGLFACPAEVIKCRLQVYSKGSHGSPSTHGGPVYNGPFDCARKIVAEGGLAGLYRGFSAFVAREIPFYFVFFSSYEAVCNVLEQRHGCTRNDLPTAQVFLAGGLAGCASWTVVVPADTIKSQMQTSDTKLSMVQTARAILAKDGVRHGLFRGWTVIMIRSLVFLFILSSLFYTHPYANV